MAVFECYVRPSNTLHNLVENAKYPTKMAHIQRLTLTLQDTALIFDDASPKRARMI